MDKASNKGSQKESHRKEHNQRLLFKIDWGESLQIDWLEVVDEDEKGERWEQSGEDKEHCSKQADLVQQSKAKRVLELQKALERVVDDVVVYEQGNQALVQGKGVQRGLEVTDDESLFLFFLCFLVRAKTLDLFREHVSDEFKD